MSGRDYANRNGDQSCEEGCFNFMLPRNSNNTVDDNVFNSGSTQEYIPNFEESIQRRERSSVDVQTVGNGNNVTTRLSSEGHDMVDITLVPVARIFDRFRNLGSNTLRSHSMSQAGADNLVNDGSIERDIPILEEIVRKRETPSVDVRIVENDGNVGRRMSTECHDVVPTTTVHVSRIFDRFRNMCLNNVGSDCMSQTDNWNHDGDHQIRTATLENAALTPLTHPPPYSTLSTYPSSHPSPSLPQQPMPPHGSRRASPPTPSSPPSSSYHHHHHPVTPPPPPPKPPRQSPPPQGARGFITTHNGCV
ncbi:hypothetical protein Tco_1391625 [Tanacetum coccineum]